MKIMWELANGSLLRAVVLSVGQDRNIGKPLESVSPLWLSSIVTKPLSKMQLVSFKERQASRVGCDKSFPKSCHIVRVHHARIALIGIKLINTGGKNINLLSHERLHRGWDFTPYPRAKLP